MEQLLSEIYEKVVYSSDVYNELNQIFDEEVENLMLYSTVVLRK